MALESGKSLCVVVLGPYRSGTSVTSRVLEGLGVCFGPTGGMFKGDRFNPGGYYERADINRANTAFIESAGGTLADPGEPEQIGARGDRGLITALDFSWRDGARLWGIKDPRMCATLGAWIAAGVLDAGRTRIVHVIRDTGAVVRSVLEFPQVREYCDGTPEGARAMVERYERLAEWQAARSGLPVFRLVYEELIARPGATAAALAEFLGVDDPAAIRLAAGAVGKRKGLLRLWAVDYPARVIRKLSGRGGG